MPLDTTFGLGDLLAQPHTEVTVGALLLALGQGGGRDWHPAHELPRHAGRPARRHQAVGRDARSSLRPEAVSTRIAHLAVVDALSVAVAKRQTDAARDTLVRDDEIVAERELSR